jgi:hypothetical protein
MALGFGVDRERIGRAAAEFSRAVLVVQVLMVAQEKGSGSGGCRRDVRLWELKYQVRRWWALFPRFSGTENAVRRPDSDNRV